MPDQKISASYELTAASTASAAVIGRITGPKGKRGRITSISAICTTAMTSPAGELLVGTAADPDKYGSMPLPVTSINERVDAEYSPELRGVAGAVDRDSVIEVSIGTANTLGAATFFINIDWS